LGFPWAVISDSTWGLDVEASLHDKSSFDGHPGSGDGAA
jgi:hypothetical protein